MKQGNIAHTKLYNLVMLHLDSPDNQKINIDPYHYNEENFDPILFHELLINVRLILENEKPSVNNMNSMGVDVACRIIIEICALLEANKQGKITDIQKKLFLLNYLTVDMDKQINKSMPDELRELLQNPYDKVIKDYQTLLGCSRAQAEQVNSERYSFLKYGGKTYSGWSSFIKTILGEEFVEYREMLNMFIHPAYTDTKITYFDEKLEDDRKKIINRILTLASSNIPELVNNDYVKSKWNDEYIDADNLERIKLIKKAFKETFKHNHNDEKWQNTSLEDDNTRYMAFSCFKKLGSTLIDMLICESLGLRNQTIIRVKSFAEMTSMLGVLIRCEDIDGIFDDFIRVSALFITNKHKNYYEVFNKVDSGNQLTENEEKNIYEPYLDFIRAWYPHFKDHHDYPDSEEEFATNIRRYPLYFIEQDTHYKYSRLVEDTVNIYIENQRTRIQINSDYKWSSRVGHACAYKSQYKENKSFNVLPNLITYLLKVFEDIYTVIEGAQFIDDMETLANDLRKMYKQNYDDKMGSKYKALEE